MTLNWLCVSGQINLFRACPSDASTAWAIITSRITTCVAAGAGPRACEVAAAPGCQFGDRLRWYADRVPDS